MAEEGSRRCIRAEQSTAQHKLSSSHMNKPSHSNAPHRRHDGRLGGHARVRVLPQEGDNLVGGDAQRECGGGALPSDGPHKQVGQQAVAAHKDAQDGDLHRRRRVGVHPAFWGGGEREERGNEGEQWGSASQQPSV